MAAVLRQCGSVYNSKKETSRSHLEFPFKKAQMNWDYEFCICDVKFSNLFSSIYMYIESFSFMQNGEKTWV